MAAPVLNQGDAVTCNHGGHASPVASNPRVMVIGQAAVTMDQPWEITGCSLAPADGGPCVSASFSEGATRITSNGQALVLTDSQGLSAPTGAPLQIVAGQGRVTGV